MLTRLSEWTGRLIAGLAFGLLVVGMAVGPIPTLAQTRPATLGGVIANPKFTGSAKFADGTECSAPSITFSTQTNFGFARSGSNSLVLCMGGTTFYDWSGTNFRMAANNIISWSTNATVSDTTTDVSMRRSAAKTWTLDTDGAGGALTLIDLKGPLGISSTISTYNGVATAGVGVGVIYGENISTTQTANFTALTQSPTANAGRWECSAVITTTSALNTGTLQVTLDYVDAQGTVHTADILPLADATGVFAASKTSVASKEFFTSPKRFTVNNANTSILLKVVITGSVSYTVSPVCRREA